jgi:hypothetical protein
MGSSKVRTTLESVDRRVWYFEYDCLEVVVSIYEVRIVGLIIVSEFNVFGAVGRGAAPGQSGSYSSTHSTYKLFSQENVHGVSRLILYEVF